jgi:hypothetical protein
MYSQRVKGAKRGRILPVCTDRLTEAEPLYRRALPLMDNAALRNADDYLRELEMSL